MAKYERPAGSYTPTKHSVNTTKYNDDEVAVPSVAISSTKVDGDINKVFDAVNELNDNAPTAVGNSGKFLKSDGTVAAYASVSGADLTASTVTVSKLAAEGVAGQVLTSNGASVPSYQTASGVPAGSTMSYAGSSTPSGWLLCYGQAVSRTTYADLFTAISTTWGSGDGSTTFNVPDMRGRAVFGKDDMGGAAASRITSGGSGLIGSSLGASGGNELMNQHNHGITDPGHVHQFTSTSVGSPFVGGYQTGAVVNGQNTSSSTTGITINNAGSGTSENMPPAAIMNTIIKT